MNLGVNITISQFDAGPHDGGTRYTFPDSTELGYFAAKGLSNVRLPINWQALQPELYGPLDIGYLEGIKDTVAKATELGLKVVLDMHDYGFYGPFGSAMIGSSTVPLSAFGDVWDRIAGSFADQPNVVFGLMNEPQLPSAVEWLSAVNEAIAAIRMAGADQQILVSGTYWDGAHSWTQTDNANVLGAPGAVSDPLKNFAFEVHQYLDDTSGQHAYVVSETIGVERLSGVTAWARLNGYKLFLGEFGVADNVHALTALDNMLGFMEANQDVWEGGSYWAAGKSWADYMFSIEPPLGMLDTAQMEVLQRYTGLWSTETVQDNGTAQVDYFVNGRSSVAIRDVIGTDGQILARTVFDPQGDPITSLERQADNTLKVTIFNPAEASLDQIVETYSADHLILSHTTVEESGTSETEFYSNGMRDNPYSSEVRNSDGDLLSSVENRTDGTHWMKTYLDSRLSILEVYDQSWNFLSRSHYDAKGGLEEIQTIDPDGHNVVEHFAPEQVFPWSREIFSVGWELLSNATRFADGTSQVMQYVSGMVRHVEYYNADDVLTRLETYDQAGQLQKMDAVLLGGGHSVTEYLQGANGGRTVDLYDTSWRISQRTHVNGDGVITAIDWVRPDDSHRVEHFAEDDGRLTSVEQYNSAWGLIERRVLAADGSISTLQADGAAGGHLVAARSSTEHGAAFSIHFLDGQWQTLYYASDVPAEVAEALVHYVGNGYRWPDAVCSGENTDASLPRDGLLKDDVSEVLGFIRSPNTVATQRPDSGGTFSGSDGTDILRGGSGDDVISGGGGVDVVAGGPGQDRVAGGRSDDVFVVCARDLGMADTTDIIVDFEGAARPGGDFILFTGFRAGAVLEPVSRIGDAFLYALQGPDGVLLEQLQVDTGGKALVPGDYIFA